MAKKKKKPKREKVDGLSPHDMKRLRSAIREVWRWSTPRKICLERAIGSDGFPRCEKCKKKSPKVFADHIIPVGVLDEGYLTRLFCPSHYLQALCQKCHSKKTKEENRAKRDFTDKY